MQKRFMDTLHAIRLEFDKPMVITSGYRDVTHPVEAKKVSPGAHTYGCAADIAVSGGDAIRLIAIAYKHGIARIGVSQKGSGRFIHIDMGEVNGFPSPALWSY
ncbi:peptidase M15A [Thalassospira marina]|uniref:Peptidase M15A n=2 Tax=Thalassospira marina TaxID=2048283 RepID=A0A2N3KYM8_9PROT|nr:peptidase M15A [Thalassospira marina]